MEEQRGNEEKKVQCDHEEWERTFTYGMTVLTLKRKKKAWSSREDSQYSTSPKIQKEKKITTSHN